VRIASFISARLAGALSAMVGASFVAFVVLRVAPGDPARLILGPLADRAAVNQLRHDLGLNGSIAGQYWHFLVNFCRGDWGYSYAQGASVSRLILDRLPATIELALFAFVGAFLSAVLLALLATYHRRRGIDLLVRVLSYVGLGVPQFWLGLVGLIVFFKAARVLPGPEGRLSASASPPPSHTGLYTVDALISGRWTTLGQALLHLLLPALTLGFPIFAFLVRLLRANLLDVRREPFVLVVRSKGIGRWATYVRHVLPNAFLPTLTASGLLLAQLIGGSVLVESVFDWPGLGQLVVGSIQRQDYSVVETFILISAFTYVVVTTLLDMLYGMIDPRVGSKRAT